MDLWGYGMYGIKLYLDVVYVIYEMYQVVRI